MKNNLILDVENLLCKKEVILSKDEILQVALFAIQNSILKLSICENGEHSNIGELENGYKVVFDNTDSFITVQH
jgi:hypothetical protein